MEEKENKLEKTLENIECSGEDDSGYIIGCIPGLALLVGGGIGYIADKSMGGNGVNGAAIGAMAGLSGVLITTALTHYADKTYKSYLDNKYKKQDRG